MTYSPFLGYWTKTVAALKYEKWARLHPVQAAALRFFRKLSRRADAASSVIAFTTLVAHAITYV